MTLRAHLADLRRRPKMFIWRFDYETLAAYVTGYDWGHDGADLTGFQEWIDRRLFGRKSSVHWAASIYQAAEGKIAGYSIEDSGQSINDRATELLFDLLDEYLSTSEAGQ